MLIFSFCLDFSVFQADTKHFEQVSHLAHDIKWAGKWQFSTDCEVLRDTIKKKKRVLGMEIVLFPDESWSFERVLAEVSER